MKNYKYVVFLIHIFFTFSISVTHAQIYINEICPSNKTIISNTDGNYADWIELFNAGSTSIDLNGYGLSDDSANAYSFTFPHANINSGGYILVFASGNNNIDLVNHWETAVKAGTSWKYLPVIANPDTNWRNLSYNAASWLSGNGGIGFGDSDDVTIIPHCRTMFMRKTFTIPDTSIIAKSVFQIDYNDGFVAYLNGVEIARANVGTPGIRPLYNLLAYQQHLPLFNQGLLPDSFYIDPVLLKSVIKQGTNVLSVEIHEFNDTIFHMSSFPYLSFGIRNTGMTFSNPPPWFSSSTDQFTANFKLNNNGEKLFLTAPNGSRIDRATFPFIGIDNSYARIPNGSSSWCYNQIPSPRASNNSSICYSGYATVPIFSIAGGFYSSSQTLTLTTGMPGGSIRYTVDGSEPTSSSIIYSGPIFINSTKIIRARIFANGFIPSSIITNSYFINENVHLPVFALNTDPVNLFDQNTGIYVTGLHADTAYPYFGANYWQNWEKPVFVEYYTADKNLEFSFSSNIKITGGYSRTKPQKSFEIKLSGDYGISSLNYALIPDKNSVSNYKDFILRNSGTDWEYAHMRDAVMQRIMKHSFIDYNPFQSCVVFLNGSFWGIYEIRENNNHNFVEENYGYKKTEIDYLDEQGSLVTKLGSDSAFFSMYTYAMNANQADSSFYNKMNEYWDLNNFTDNFITETYYCNEDWIGPWTDNIKLWRPRTVHGKWKYILNDLDFGLGLFSRISDNMLDTAIHPRVLNFQSDIFRTLLNNPIYKRYFINRYADLINTNYLPSTINSLVNQVHDSLAFDMPRHWATFPGFGGSVNAWMTSINNLKNFINGRPPYARNYIQSEFGMTSQVSLTLNVQPAGAGRIQISTVTPLSYPWSGIYFNGNPVTISAIPNPGYTFNYWHSDSLISHNTNQIVTINFNASDQITAHFTGAPSAATITISEFNYHSDSIADAGDWIELHNYGNSSVDISGWKINDESDNHRFIFPTITSIPADGYLVIAENLTKFYSQHPTVTNVICPLGFSLSNYGEQIRIFDYKDSLFLSMYYQISQPWPVSANGKGYTCERLNQLNNPNDGSNWFAGCLGGTPGRVYSAPSANVTVNRSAIFCSGDTVNLFTSNIPGYIYQWQRNHVDLSGEVSETLNVTLGGAYTLKVNFQGCTVISDSIVLMELQHGEVPIISQGYHCGPGTVNLSASANDTIYWYDSPGGILLDSGNTFTSPFINTSTVYFVQSGKLCPGQIRSALASIKNIPLSPLTTSGQHCGRGQVFISGVSSDTIFWYDQPVNGNLLGIGNSYLTDTLNSSATIYAIAGSVCPSIPSPVVAAIYQLPNLNLGNDTIINSGTILALDAGPGFIHYSWSTGDSSQTIQVQVSDTFSVMVTDLHGCSNTDSISVTIYDGLTSLNNSNLITVFPNPSDGKINIQFGKTLHKCRLEIFNVLSQNIYREEINNVEKLSIKKVDLNILKGTYLLKVIFDDEIDVMTFIVN